MGKSTTSIRFPDDLVDELDRRAAAMGITRTELVVQAVERALEERSTWSPAFLKAIEPAGPEVEAAADEMMDAIRAGRTRSKRPRL
jgi:predicted transcriptional regulator